MRAPQPASVTEPALQQLAEVWRQRWPFPSTASPDAALTVHGVRRLILGALPPRVSREVISQQQLACGTDHRVWQWQLVLTSTSRHCLAATENNQKEAAIM